MTNSAPTGTAADLTRHIESRYHARHREQLPDMLKLAGMIEDLHDGDEGVPEGLTDILRRLGAEMEAHITKEQLILFPAIRKGGTPGIAQMIAAIRADHANHHKDMAQIRKIAGGFTLPQGACTSWATLYAGVARLVDDMTEHMRLEHEVLFPEFEPEDDPDV